jgi:hypothetical protein
MDMPNCNLIKKNKKVVVFLNNKPIFMKQEHADRSQLYKCAPVGEKALP